MKFLPFDPSQDLKKVQEVAEAAFSTTPDSSLAECQTKK